MKNDLSPFLDYLKKLISDRQLNDGKAADIIGISASSLSRILGGKQAITDDFIFAFVKKLASEDELKKELITEYLNHKAWEFNTSYYGCISTCFNENYFYSKDCSFTKQLIEFIRIEELRNPKKAEQIAQGLLNLIKGLKEETNV